MHEIMNQSVQPSEGPDHLVAGPSQPTVVQRPAKPKNSILVNLFRRKASPSTAASAVATEQPYSSQKGLNVYFESPNSSLTETSASQARLKAKEEAENYKATKKVRQAKEIAGKKVVRGAIGGVFWGFDPTAGKIAMDANDSEGVGYESGRPENPVKSIGHSGDRLARRKRDLSPYGRCRDLDNGDFEEHRGHVDASVKGKEPERQ